MKYVILSIAAVILLFMALAGVTLYQSRDYGTQESEQAMQLDAGTQVVTYDGTTFTPAKLTVKAGTTVIFSNTSERPMWVASDVHPTHELYPEFDTGATNGGRPSPGEDGEFTFERIGTWSYHDHNNPSVTGTVVVN